MLSTKCMLGKYIYVVTVKIMNIPEIEETNGCFFAKICTLGYKLYFEKRK